MAEPAKDTIYIDIDDEITGIIDKVKSSNGKIVALVLPKRAGVFQSIVNMKLLKRSADEAKKHLVLITTEAGLLPLAGAAGVHVAKSLNSKPEIPSAPTPDDQEETVDESTDELEEVTPENSGDRPIGELAGAAAVGAVAADGMETIELDDDELPEDINPSDVTSAKPSAPKPKKDKKLKVPDFDRFRLLLLGGGALLVILIFCFFFANNVLPKAKILINTDATAVDTSINLNLSTTASDVNTEDNTIPAKKVEQQKTYTQQSSASGKQNKGNKATGSVSMTAKKCSGNPFIAPSDVPAGTGISSGGQTYITQSTASFHGTGTEGGCFTYSAGGSIGIVAQAAGEKYNTGSTSFSVSGRSDVSANGSADGGTDNNVTVVTQGDIDSAKSKINLNDQDIKKTLESQLKDAGYYPVLATYSSGSPKVTTSANAGDEASSVTVTEAVTYTMFGVKEDDLKTLVNNSVKDQIDTEKQAIIDQGLDQATFNVNSNSATGVQLTMSTTATAGPDLNIDEIKQEAAGKKPGEVKDVLEANPDVKKVEVKLSPFWVSSVPKKTNKITVVIAKPASNASSNNDSNP